MASPVKHSKPISVLHDIFVWSIGRPAWQCDALRRIITKETLNETDKAELENLCRQTPDALAANGKPLVAVALAAEHMPAGPNAQASVSIEYLSNLTGVNRLPAGQKITFGPGPGLTVIYGDNGTGKSGYVRVIKKACRTRGAPPVIRPDAFAATHPQPTCDIGIKTASGSSEVKWVDGKAADEKLSNVFVFDSVAASHYLQVTGQRVSRLTVWMSCRSCQRFAISLARRSKATSMLWIEKLLSGNSVWKSIQILSLAICSLNLVSKLKQPAFFC